MPKGKYRVAEAIMIVDNLYWLDEKSLKEHTIDMDGINSIGQQKNDITYIFTQGDLDSDATYSYFINTPKGNLYYKFNKHGELVWIGGTYIEVKEKINEQEKKEIYNQVQALIQPIVDKQDKPAINLQWLFNLVNYRRFND